MWRKAMVYLFFAAIFVALALAAPSLLPKTRSVTVLDEEGNPTIREDKHPAATASLVIRGAGILLAVIFVLSTSFVIIDADSVGHINRIYMGDDMGPGQIIALSGQKGPQAEILPPGFHFRLFLNVLNDVEEKSIINIPEGKYGFLTAKDGVPLDQGQYLAPRWDEKAKAHMMDAQFFLTNNGRKGPQLTVLPPGKYRINRYLFDVELQDALDIPAGFVGVVKSNVQETPEPEMAALPKELAGRLVVPLMKKGSAGIWVDPINPGRYYLNRVAYNVTLVDTRVQTWNYKGGYERRYIDLQVTQDGRITQKERAEQIVVPEDAADAAIFTRMEGWLVPQELRVQVQVEPGDAPILVASVGSVESAEDKVVTPSIRSVVRNICAGEKVLSLIDENRADVEDKIEEAVIPEGKKAGVTIKDVRLVDSVVPPELLVARLREQLAQQLRETYKREKDAQDQRIETEKARATADQQPELVSAEIRVMVAEKDKLAEKLKGEGEKLRLIEVATGQKAQVEVLGQDKVMQLSVLEKVLDAAVANPDIVKVPSVLVQGQGNSLEGAAAILGASSLVQGLEQASRTPPPAPARPRQ
ncbi:MAG: hypothetical protein KKA60_05020 [Proteobacteria bacterium]|nr:hypothetical protein [Pseudomonadota bacterium]